jgi:hypothetical protein
MKQYTEFEDALMSTLADIRKELQHYEDMSHIRIKITASGMIHTGQVEVSFFVSQSDYDEIRVRGNDLGEAIREYIRRRGWQRRHARLMLTDENQAMRESE